MPAPQRACKPASLSLKEFVTHLVPKSIVEAMANNEILQIVVFSIFFGLAAAASRRAREDDASTAIDRPRAHHAQDHGYVMSLRTHCGVRGDGGDRDDTGPRHSGRPTANSWAGSTSSLLVLWSAARRSPGSCSSGDRVFASVRADQGADRCSRSARPSARRPIRRRMEQLEKFRRQQQDHRASCCRSAIRSISTAR